MAISDMLKKKLAEREKDYSLAIQACQEMGAIASRAADEIIKLKAKLRRLEKAA